MWSEKFEKLKRYLYANRCCMDFIRCVLIPEGDLHHIKLLSMTFIRNHNLHCAHIREIYLNES